MSLTREECSSPSRRVEVKSPPRSKRKQLDGSLHDARTAAADPAAHHRVPRLDWHRPRLKPDLVQRSSYDVLTEASGLSMLIHFPSFSIPCLILISPTVLFQARILMNVTPAVGGGLLADQTRPDLTHRAASAEVHHTPRSIASLAVQVDSGLARRGSLLMLRNGNVWPQPTFPLLFSRGPHRRRPSLCSLPCASLFLARRRPWIRNIRLQTDEIVRDCMLQDGIRGTFGREGGRREE